MTKASEFYLPSSTACGRIRVKLWDLEGASGVRPKGVVQIVHGMAEHIDRYDELAGYLNACGYVVVGNDHAGHGKSISSNCPAGFFEEKSGWDGLISDLRSVKAVINDRFPDLPKFMLGHSMGSFLARSYAYRTRRTVFAADAYIFSGTAGSNPALGIAKLLTSLLIKLHGTKADGDFINKLAFGSYNRLIHGAKTPFDWLSTDAGIVQKYVADPLCGFVFTLGGFRDLFFGLGEINSKICFEKLPDCRYLLIAGTDDPVGNYGRGVEDVYRRMREYDLDVSMKLYKGARHEVHNDFCRKELFDDIVKFLDDQMR